MIDLDNNSYQKQENQKGDTMEDKSLLTKHYLRPIVAVGLPFLWTLASGVLAGLAAASLAWSLFGFDPLRSAVAAAAVTVTIVWPLSWQWWQGKLDGLNRGVQLSRPTRMEVYLNGGRQKRPFTLPATPQEIHAIAVKVAAGVSLSGRKMAGIMPADKFYLLQAAMVEAKLAKPRSTNHKDGVELTEYGWQTMQAIAASALPLPEVDGEFDVFTFTQHAHTGANGAYDE
jgi:hypothetical protein